MLFCAVVGVIPPDPQLAAYLREQHSPTNNKDGVVQWRSTYSLAPDEDRNGAMTMLLTALCDDRLPSVEQLVTAVQHVVQEYYRDNSHNTSSLGSSSEVSVELWASAPAPLPLLPLDGYEDRIRTTTRIPIPHSTSGHQDNNNNNNNNNKSDHKSDHKDDTPTTTITAAVTAMREWGLVVQPKILHQDHNNKEEDQQQQQQQAIVVDQFRHIVDDAIATIETALTTHHPHLVVGQDTILFREIASRNHQRFDLRLQDSPEAVQLVHQHILSQPGITQFLQQAMGLSSSESESSSESLLLDEIDFDLSVVYSRPGAGAQGWHADGDHLPGESDAGWDELGWQNQLAYPYAICLFVPLVDLNEEIGYTQFWPGSHQHRALIGFGPVAKLTNSVWNASSCQAGDGIWYDYRLLHQGMPNTSQHIVRPVLQIIFKKKRYVEKSNYGIKSLYPE
jgi:ectoine hydroxylase-related dioxygenase (phytanoyl-CoA dioxygenase family)